MPKTAKRLEYDKILYGRDEEEHIVGIHPHGSDSVRIYKRNPNTDLVSHRDERIYPFMWASREAALELNRSLPDGYFDAIELEGDNHYQWVIFFDESEKLYKGRAEIYDRVDVQEETFKVSLVEQYLIQSGKTQFLGMQPEDVHRMQLDIEVYSSTESFPNAEREGDEIIIIALSDNRGFERVLHTSHADVPLPDHCVECESEEWLLMELVKTIHRQNPDVIEGHNIFGFDWEYIQDRAEMLGVHLGIGRNGQEPRSFTSKKKFAEREFEYQNFLIDGRSVIDTMFHAIDYDSYKRDLPGLGLKKIARHFGVAAPDREYVEGRNISNVWDEDPARLLRYALDDVKETKEIGEILSNSTFYITQMLPKTYQQAHLAGTASTLESLFLREYARQRHSVPAPEEGKQKHGGYTDIFRRGVYDNLCYADVSSLYPSIMLNYDIQPERDTLELFQYFLQRLTDMRLDAKQQMNELPPGDPARQELDARQSAQKILINSAYGLCGFRFAKFNDFSEADRVATTGQGLLRRMIEIIEDKGGTPILTDTDGVLFELPREMTDDEVNEFVAGVSEIMPAGINVDNDGRFDRVLSYRKKNYILKKPDGDVKITGGSFKSRMIEPFGRAYVKEVALALLERDVQKAHDIHERYKEMIVQRDWHPDDFCKRATIKDSLDVYREKLRSNDNKNPQAQYELAIRLEEVYEQEVYPGDTVEYYIAGNKPQSRVTGYEDAKLRREWEPGDENIHWYLKRLKDFSKKFKPFFHEKEFGWVFSDVVPKGNFNLFEAPSIDVDIVNSTLKESP